MSPRRFWHLYVSPARPLHLDYLPRTGLILCCYMAAAAHRARVLCTLTFAQPGMVRVPHQSPGQELKCRTLKALKSK